MKLQDRSHHTVYRGLEADHGWSGGCWVIHFFFLFWFSPPASPSPPSNVKKEVRFTVTLQFIINTFFITEWKGFVFCFFMCPFSYVCFTSSELKLRRLTSSSSCGRYMCSWVHIELEGVATQFFLGLIRKPKEKALSTELNGCVWFLLIFNSKIVLEGKL